MKARRSSQKNKRTTVPSRGASDKAKANAAGPNRVMLRRLLKIHDRFNDVLQTAAKVNCSTLADELEVAPRTIQRDLDYMRNELDLPLEYDHETRGFYYDSSTPVPFPVGHNLSADERISLAVARQCLTVFEGVDFGGHLASAFNKLTDGVIGEPEQGIEVELDAYLSICTPGAGRVEAQVFRGVRIALLRHRELAIEYLERDAIVYTARILHPLHLACVANRWVLIARDADTQNIETFVMARLRGPKVSERLFVRPHGFDPRPFLGTAFGAWTERGKTVVRLRISAAGAHHVLERNWHPSQSVALLPGGSVDVSFELGSLYDVARWVLGFGADCEVLAPPQLRAFVEDQAQHMARRNATSGVGDRSLGPRGAETFVGYLRRASRQR